jgi:tRNA-2-methylthio-N6-dimethylallyladenosine synthase
VTVRGLPVLDLPVRPTGGGETSHIAPRVAPELEEYVLGPESLPRFFVWTLGCQMNHSDSEEMAGALLAAGCAEADALEDADLVVINSCAIREAAEQKVIGRMGQLASLKRARPGTRVVLTGCSVRADNRDVLGRRYPAVDLFLRPDEEPELVARLGLASVTSPGSFVTNASGSQTAHRTGAQTDRVSFARVGRSFSGTADRLPAARASAVAGATIRRQSPWEAWVPVIYGCDKTCTYCIVPFSRGPERSRPFDDILDECRALARGGALTVSLLGQNVNSYGHDLSPEPRFADLSGGRPLGRRIDTAGRPDFAALLRAIDGLRLEDGGASLPRVRFVTSHPWDLTDRLIEAIAECPSVCEHLHLPVQSGDDAVLHRMGRQYTVEGYLRLVEKLRAAVPGIALSSDVIVGFSGETERQFEATMELLRTVRYDQVFAAAYSVRPGTPAARLPDDVPPVEKRRRLNALLELQEGIGWEINRSWTGRTTEVLVDQVDRPTSHDDGKAGAHRGTRVAGRNRENKLIHLDGEPDLVGRFVPVRVEHAGAYSLQGVLIEA